MHIPDGYLGPATCDLRDPLRCDDTDMGGGFKGCQKDA